MLFDEETMAHLMKLVKISFDATVQVAEEIDLKPETELSPEELEKVLARMVEVGIQKLTEAGMDPDGTIEDHLEKNK